MIFGIVMWLTGIILLIWLQDEIWNRRWSTRKVLEIIFWPIVVWICSPFVLYIYIRNKTRKKSDDGW